MLLKCPEDVKSINLSGKTLTPVEGYLNVSVGTGRILTTMPQFRVATAAEHKAAPSEKLFNAKKKTGEKPVVKKPVTKSTARKG